MHPLRSVRSKTLTLSLAACLLPGCIPAVAQQTPLAGRTATVKVKNVPLADALQQTFASAGTTFTVTPAAQELMRSMTVTANLEGVRLSTAVYALLRTVASSFPPGKRLVASERGDSYVIDVGDALPAVPAAGAPPARRDDRDMRPVTLKVHDAPLADVLFRLAAQTGVGYRVHPALEEAFHKATVSLDVANLPLRDAARVALSSAKGLPRAYAAYENGVVAILPVFQPSPNVDLASKRVTVNARGMDAWRALKALLDSASVDYAFCNEAYGGARVSLDLKGAPLDEALAAFLAQIPGGPRPGFASRGGVVCASVLPSPADASTLHMTFHLRHADVRYAVKALFTSVGLNYTLDGSAVGQTTVEGVAVAFPLALHDILAATPAIAPLEFRLDRGVYSVAPSYMFAGR